MLKKRGLSSLRIISQYNLFNYLVHFLSRKIGWADTLKIADLGCGDKSDENEIRKAFAGKSGRIEYTGIDYYSKEADIKLDINTQKLPFPDNSVDIIICKEVLEHLFNPFFALEEMKRVLKENGYLLITTPFMFKVHEKEHDYLRFNYNFFRKYFSRDKIIAEALSNTSFSFFLYFIKIIFFNFPFGRAKKAITKIIGWLQLPIDKIALYLFGNFFFTYSMYVDGGVIVQIKH